MGIPYMGSKRGHVGKIFSVIKNFNPNKDVLVDLFCGGFAVSEYFLKNGFKVIANDKNKFVIALIKKIIFEGFPEKEVLKFVTRDKFFDVINNKNNYEDWFVGFVMCIWSFGNNQRSYLFGRDVEQYKKAGHDLVVDKDPTEILKLIPNIHHKYIDGILKQSDWHKRRMALRIVCVKLKNRIIELEQLQQLERLEQLEQLQQLERLQQLEQLQRLELYSDDYSNINIPDNAIIYCDPPYAGTATYSENNFNHEEFWNWVEEKSKTNKIYVSEYNAPERWKKVLSFSRNSTLCGGSNRNQPDECLFTC